MFLNDPRDDREAKPNSPYRVEKRIEEPLLHLGDKPGPLSSTSMMTTSRILPRSAIRLSSARALPLRPVYDSQGFGVVVRIGSPL